VAPGQGGSEIEFVVNGGQTPRIAPNGMPFSTGGTEAADTGTRQVCRTRSTGGNFKRRRAVLLRLRRGSNTVKIMVPKIRRREGMALRALTLRPEK